jgi:hypothetical protein
MSYRYNYNTTDIIVGVGMCAIVFGALLFFLAANGTIQATPPQAIVMESSSPLEVGMMWLQPAVGEAIVEQTVGVQRANSVMAAAASEWNRATLASGEFRTRSDNPFGSVMHQAEVMPAEHRARVQAILGQAIVNFTQRGVRTGAFSADQYLSDYNSTMIRAAEYRGQQLDRGFSSNWQTTLGRDIVWAFQTSTSRAERIQERVGAASIQVLQAQQSRDDSIATQQPQLGSLIVAAIRTDEMMDRATLLAAIESLPETTAVASTAPAALPDMPIGFLFAAGVLLVAVFFGGLSMTAGSREAKAAAAMQYDSAKWVYRLAA